MTVLLVGMAVFVPLLLAIGLYWPRRTSGMVMRLAPWAALPALVLAIGGETPIYTIDWLLLGSSWGVDHTGRIFLALTGMLWLMSGIFAGGYMADDPRRRRFFLSYLLAMSGNVGLILAHDIAGFLSFFALMSFASYGLVIHQERSEDWRAGRIYLVLVVIGELLLVSGALVAISLTESVSFPAIRAGLAGSPAGILAAWLLLLGFGVKLGLVPLHVWLPLAHPAAPTPASAVLSGAMIKGGLIGMLRVLPFGDVALPMGEPLMWLGVGTAMGAALYGIPHTHPKTILAYSSVSQMGLVFVLLGAGLSTPTAWPALLPAILLVAVHHAMAKGALFLGVGVADCEWRARWQRRLVGGTLAVLGLALAGLPFTSGAAAKLILKSSIAEAMPPGFDVLEFVLPLTGITTTLLISRFLCSVWPKDGHGHHAPRPAIWLPWALLTAVVLVLPWIALGWGGRLAYAVKWLAPEYMVKAMWPIVAGGGLIAAWMVSTCYSVHLRRWRLPAGDLLVVACQLADLLLEAWRFLVARPAGRLNDSMRSGLEQIADTWHTLPFGKGVRYERWDLAGALVPLLGLLIWLLAG